MLDIAHHLIEWFIDSFDWIFGSVVIGGGLWKGLTAVATALEKRANAINIEKRLDFDQMQANYENAMSMMDKQAERIGALHEDIERGEKRNDELIQSVEQYEQRFMKRQNGYIEKIEALEIELINVKNELLITQNDYAIALERITALEVKTGPLSEKESE